MKKNMFPILLLGLLFMHEVAVARDTEHHFPIADAMESEAAKGKLDAGVKFYFAGQKTPKVKTKLREATTNKKTNAFNKSDKEACEWAFLSAMVQLQEKAKELDADAVINIQSYYKKDAFKSSTEYECHAGGLLAGVALKGEFVKLAK